MASPRKIAPKTIFLLELIRKTNHIKTGEPLEIRRYLLYETISAAKSMRTREIRYNRSWKVTGHIFSGVVEWNPLPEYEESVHEDMLSRLTAEMSGE